MNDKDKNNLKFLMYSSEDVLDTWYARASDDDMKYALELLARYREELNEQEMEYIEYKDAKSVLGKYTLKGKI